MKKFNFFIKKHQLYWAFASIFFIIIVYYLTAPPSNVWLLLSNLVVMVLSLAGMALKAERIYSLEKMVYVFFFFFMGVVPLNDLCQNNLYWGGRPFKEDTFIFTNVLLIFGILVFNFGANLKFNKSRILNYFGTIYLEKINRLIFMVYFLSVAFIILYIFDFNFIRLLVRGVGADFDFEQGVQLNQIQGLLFGIFIRPAPVVLLLIFHYSFFVKNSCIAIQLSQSVTLFNKCLLLFVFIMTVVLISPTSVARFLAAALYIPLILVFTRFWDKPYRMQFSIIASLLVIMPMLDKFRYFDATKIDFSFDLSFLNHGHFDAYQNFARTVELDLVTYGNQLLGAMLFFVPRVVWPNKAIGSGAFLSENANYNFSNISMPFIGEGYINFGLFGIIGFMFILGMLVNNLDAFVWRLKSSGVKSILIYYYYVLFGLIFFIMRGDLLSSFAFAIGLSVSFWSMVFLFRLQRIKF